MDSRLFRWITGIAAFLSTLIWLFFLFLGDTLRWTTREEFMRLHESPWLTVRGVITMACFIFAVLAMAGLHERIRDRSGGLSLTALIFFAGGAIIDATFRAIEWMTVHRTWAKAWVASNDEIERARILANVDLVDEASLGIALTFGAFFAVSSLLFAVATWREHRPLSIAFTLGGLYILIAYSAALFASPLPSLWWTFYEVLQISIGVMLGMWLLQAPADNSRVTTIA